MFLVCRIFVQNKWLIEGLHFFLYRNFKAFNKIVQLNPNHLHWFALLIHSSGPGPNMSHKWVSSWKAFQENVIYPWILVSVLAFLISLLLVLWHSRCSQPGHQPSSYPQSSSKFLAQEEAPCELLGVQNINEDHGHLLPVLLLCRKTISHSGELWPNFVSTFSFFCKN